MPHKPWEAKWTIQSPLGEGGQGTTLLVSSASEPRGVLKILKSQKNEERRARMHREVSALQTLKHRGLPRLLDSNTNQFRERVPLYHVTEFIEGGTLGEHVEAKLPRLSEALELLMALSDVLHYAHGEGTVHRDIKPDNIVLRNGAYHDPVLIDFGLSYNSAFESAHSTHDSQQLGNRFLALPELQLKSGLRRDPRSDLSQTVGILLYCVTGHFPVTLFDSEQRLPHQREDAKRALESIPSPARERIVRLFDQGFAHHLDARIQSARALSDLVKSIQSPPAVRSETLDPSALAELLSSRPDYARKATFQDAIEYFREECWQGARLAEEQLQCHLVRTGTNRQVDWMRYRLENDIGLTHRFLDDVKFVPVLRCTATGNECIVESHTPRATVELLRFPLGTLPTRWQLARLVEAHLADGISQFLEEHSLGSMSGKT